MSDLHVFSGCGGSFADIEYPFEQAWLRIASEMLLDKVLLRIVATVNKAACSCDDLSVYRLHESDGVGD